MIPCPALDLHLLAATGGLFAVLVAASFITMVLAGLSPSAEIQEVVLRVRSWWVIVTLGCGALIGGTLASLGFFALVSFLALREYHSLVPLRPADREMFAWACFAIPLQYALIGAHPAATSLLFVPLYALLVLPARMAMIGETKGFLHAAANLQWGLMLAVFSLGHLAFLLVLPGAGHPAATGARLVLYLLILTELNDVFQYLWGKSLGRRKVVPRVSPNKSWAGLIGGAGTTVLLAALLAPYLTPLRPAHALAAGGIIGLGGFLGDITMSALKRDLGLQHSGKLLPGHGGILDRVDSLVFTAPLFTHLVRWLCF